MIIGLDFETRSRANLKKTGQWRYAEDPSTSVLCAAWAFDDGPTKLWHPAVGELPEEGAEDLRELAEMLRSEVWAWNAGFERAIWELVLRRQVPWLPQVPEDSWRCSAALAASYALPRDLDGAAGALGLSYRKDAAGKRVMMKLSQPRKADGGWHEGTEDLRALFAYCRQDVEVERAIREQVGEWTPEELAVWRLDQRINARGMYLDRAMAAGALVHAQHERDRANVRVRALTRGTITKTTKRSELLDWVADEGVQLSNAQKGTLEAMLEDPDEASELPPLPDLVREVLSIWLDVNRTSTNKYRAMLARVCADGRIRDLLRYHGASTGRWAGQGIQPQNFPRGTVKFDPEQAARDIASLDTETLAIIWDRVMPLLASALRAAMRAAPGHELMAADYSSIEARGLFWLAGDEEALDVLRAYDRREGPALYNVQAGQIYDLPPEQVEKGTLEYQLGKQAVLGLGYQMGAPKFVTTCAGYGIPLELPFARKVVAVYRTSHPQVPALWAELERLAIQAVKAGDGAPWLWDQRRLTAWAVRGRFLHCRLPSGRLLSYAQPWVEPVPFIWTDPETGEKKDLGVRDKLFFWGVDSKTHKWSVQTTYGGKLTENVVQALCRDLMAAAMLRCEAAGYPVVLTVHDEVVSEVPEGFGDLAAFEALVAETPRWAAGLPVTAEGWRGTRYRK